MAARKRRKGTLEQVLGTPAECARIRIELCERYGLDVDPRDIEIVRAAEESNA